MAYRQRNALQGALLLIITAIMVALVVPAYTDALILNEELQGSINRIIRIFLPIAAVAFIGFGIAMIMREV